MPVSPLTLGGNVFGWSADEDASFAVLDAYVEAGGNTIDSANVYSAWVPGNPGGVSEAILGRWLAGRDDRDDLVVITKVGMAGGDMPKGLSRDKILRGASAWTGSTSTTRTRTTPTRRSRRRCARSTSSSARAS
jgi:aryl-alcohol dehydrogenase-like predicted oxidoreductase